MRFITTPCILLVAVASMAQTIGVQPYLQDAEPTRMTIMWETTSGTQSTVDYGKLDAVLLRCMQVARANY